MNEKTNKAIVIDDDEVSLAIIGAVLQSIQFPFETYTDSVEAWKNIQKCNYSLYILDWRMPNLDGITLVKKIRDLYGEDAAILMLSSNEEDDEIDEAMKVGVDDYQIKPIGVTLLRRRIRILQTRSKVVAERAQIQKNLKDSQAHFKAIFDNSAVGVMVMDTNGHLLEYNSTLNKMVGFLDIKEKRNFLPAIIHPDEETKLEEFFKFLVNDGRSQAIYDTRLVTRSGYPLWVKLSISRVSEINAKEFFIIIFEDVTDQKMYEAQLNHDALHDTLTNLPNRELFLDRLNNVIYRWQNHKHKFDVLFSVFMLDIDRFQIINESLGHSKGDELIRMLAKRLLSVIDPEDTLARLTGDEFAIISERYHAVDEVSYYIKTLQDSFKEPFIIDGHEINVTTSIGVKCFTKDEKSSTGDVLRDADTALHRAKETGSNRYEFFITKMNVESKETLELENDLRKAIDTDELELYFQPQVDLNINRISGVEALIRWNHSKRGLLSPSKFIPLAEKAGLIIDIGEWVLEKAMGKMAHWSGLGYKPITMAINFSAPQFHQKGLLKIIKDMQKRFPCRDNKLKIEITESILLENPDRAVSTLKDLSDSGVLLALDDFGTGYSSLTYLKTLPIDFIKIDQSFIKNIAHNESDRSIVMAIIAMSHSLKKKAIAEGVEKLEQLNMLTSMYCDMVQGFYISRPMQEHNLLKYLDKHLNSPYVY